MPSAETRTVVEDAVPLSRSILWDLQRRYYLGRGPRAWSDGEVPTWITSNPLIAGFYAELVVTWALEGLKASPPRVHGSEPVVILELGSGPGLFAHRFLRRLTALQEVWRPAGLSFRYVMSDLAAANVAAWKAHPAFEPFFETGLLTVARFDPLTDGAVVELEGERPLVAGATRNPIVAIANYFFDSIPTDLVRVQAGRALHGRVTTTSPEPLGAHPDPSVIGSLEHEWSWRDYDLEPYDSATLDELVRFYTDALSDATFPFPVAGFRVLETLDELSSGRLLLLTADKGANHLSRFGGSEHTSIVRHGDGFSFDANPDALGRWVVANGGFVLHNHAGAPLSITALVLGERPADVPGTRLAWRRTIDARDPSEFYPHLKTFIDADGDLPAMHLVTLLRESAWDPYVVSTLQRKTVGGVRDLPSRRKQQLLAGLQRTWNNYFHLGERQDLPFLFGSLAFALEAWEDARRWFQASVDLYGAGPAALHNIGLTWAKVDRWATALPYFEAALEHKADYGPAKKFVGLARRVVAAERAAAAATDDDAAVPPSADDAAPERVGGEE